MGKASKKIIAKTITGIWVHLNEHKEIIKTFANREEAIKALKEGMLKKEKTLRCRHSNRTKEIFALGPKRLNQGWFGYFCQDCQWFILRDSEKTRTKKVRARIIGQDQVVLLQKPIVTMETWKAELKRRKRTKDE